MPVIGNSQRRIYQATYVPIRTDQDDPTILRVRSSLTRFGDKRALLQALRLRPGEVEELRRTVQSTRAIDRERQGPILALLDALDTADPGAGALSAGAREALVGARADTLVLVGRTLAQLRREKARKLTGLVQEFLTAQPPAAASVEAPRAEAPAANTRRRARAAAGARVDVGEVSTRVEALAPVETDLRSVPGVDVAFGAAAVRDPKRYGELLEAADELFPAPSPLNRRSPLEALRDLFDGLGQWGPATDTAVDGFEERMKVEPVGRLYLERLDFSPAGMERGELLYSLPLAPLETVRLTHKEWSLRSEEFEQIVQDTLEGYSEEGVTEKNDITQSTESQTQHSRALSLSASYSYVGISANVGYNQNDANAKSQQDSRNRSIEVTRKASSRTRKEHKVSFKVTSVAGVEDEAVRVISNPRSDTPMRLDYFQLMRKWRVDLRRYGLRMTYDIVIPSPGADLLARYEELHRLSTTIERPFEFTLPLTAITPQNWTTYAALYGAQVPPPPELVKWVSAYLELPGKSEDEARLVDYDALEFDVHEDYEVQSSSFEAWFSTDSDLPEPNFDVMWDAHAGTSGGGNHVSYLENFTGKSGRLTAVFQYENIRHGAAQATLRLRPKDATLERWRFAAWTAMRQAAEESFHANRQAMLERRDSIKAELAATEALSLRQIEREEIMKGAMRWLFGPSFDFVPPDVQSLFNPGQSGSGGIDRLDVGALTDASWQRVMEFGEFAKFLHQAIEWENVLYFAYPYFWDSPRNWTLKQALSHPDSLHRTFLRAGSARVVLTIRPGFEESFAALIETGAFGTLPGNHPYMTIAQEIRAQAETTYPGIPSANPEIESDATAVNEAERGELIGSWYEYTPSPGIDVAIDSPLSNLA